MNKNEVREKVLYIISVYLEQNKPHKQIQLSKKNHIIPIILKDVEEDMYETLINYVHEIIWDLKGIGYIEPCFHGHGLDFDVFIVPKLK